LQFQLAMHTTTTKTLMVAVMAAVLLPALARAETAEVQTEVNPPSAASRVSLRVGTGLAVARGGAVISGGAGFDVTSRFNLGVEAEYSPWFDYLAGKASLGTASAYATASFRWFGMGAFGVRSGLMAGASVLLFDTPGAPAGSVGILLGANVLRVEARLAERVTFELSPDVVLLVPSLKGVPLVYSQFRLSAGIRFTL
jgi:hypothetical protein